MMTMFGRIPPKPADKTMFLVPHSIDGEIATLTKALIFEKSMYLDQAACWRRASGTVYVSSLFRERSESPSRGI